MTGPLDFIHSLQKTALTMKRIPRGPFLAEIQWWKRLSQSTGKH